MDSTRAGKRMPDALSKTIPIWCAVVNRAVKIRRRRWLSGASSKSAETLAEEEWDGALYTPPGVVSAQEHRQIEERLENWAENLAVSQCAIPIYTYLTRTGH